MIEAGTPALIKEAACSLHASPRPESERLKPTSCTPGIPSGTSIGGGTEAGCSGSRTGCNAAELPPA
ncbi:hypothetical protein PCCS19_29260 [Paenibacillus sp. CCS19]|nr:hypothetical protein PCCS19_29260 [Paenibacillus cellulosilyticus]